MDTSLGELISTPIKILSGQQESAPITTKGLSLAGVLMPAAFTGTAITFEACATVDGTFVPVYKAGVLLSYAAAQAQYLAIDPKDFQGIQFLKIKSGSAEGADRTLICSMKGI